VLFNYLVFFAFFFSGSPSSNLQSNLYVSTPSSVDKYETTISCGSSPKGTVSILVLLDVKLKYTSLFLFFNINILVPKNLVTLSYICKDGSLRISTDENNSIDSTQGDWTFVEGAENLYVVNNKNNKKYKLTMVEVS